MMLNSYFLRIIEFVVAGCQIHKSDLIYVFNLNEMARLVLKPALCQQS